MPRPKHILATPDYRRICELPRRHISEDDAAAWQEIFTAQLAVPGSRARLLKWQGYALAEAGANDGAVMNLPVGTGKTLVCELLPVVMKARRPVLLIHGSLQDKTRADRRSFRGQWRTAQPPPLIITLQRLAQESNADLLERLQPDLIIVDEADELRNPGASVPKRIERLRRRQHKAGIPVAKYVALSGTLTRGSFLEIAHHLIWALGDGAPVPLDGLELRRWDTALELAKRSWGVGVVYPGVLGESRNAARRWCRERLIQTPGVLMVDEDSAGDVPIYVELRPAKEDRALNRHYKTFLTEFENPGGIPASDPLSRWQLDTWLGSGVYNFYDPPPPEGWSDARRGVAKLVRDVIARSDQCDTEKQVLRKHESHPAVEEWQEVRDDFDPRSAAQVAWVSGSTVDTAREWLAESDAPGIIWTGIVEFGEVVAQSLGLPYFGSKGRDANGRGLHEAKATDGSMVVSWNANFRGFNLQAWDRMAIFQLPSSSMRFEQMLGRSHRYGRVEPVSITVFATSGGTYDTWAALYAETERVQVSTSITNKLLRADVEITYPKVTKRNRYRWAMRAEGE